MTHAAPPSRYPAAMPAAAAPKAPHKGKKMEKPAPKATNWAMFGFKKVCALKPSAHTPEPSACCG